MEIESQQATQLTQSSTLKVLHAARDLHALRQLVTRESLEQATGLVLHVVDERIRVLINQQLLVRKQKGVYEPASCWPEPRPMSKTLLPGGLVKIEVGDVVLNLSPDEDRMLAHLQAGSAAQLTAIESNRLHSETNSIILNRLSRLERRKDAPRAKAGCGQHLIDES